MLCPPCIPCPLIYSGWGYGLVALPLSKKCEHGPLCVYISHLSQAVTHCVMTPAQCAMNHPPPPPPPPDYTEELTTYQLALRNELMDENNGQVSVSGSDRSETLLRAEMKVQSHQPDCYIASIFTDYVI